MKCHYEVLDISREADDNEIKTAYRKLALKWHPDKNLENTEYAKEQFQLVQQAYEVLSDRQERAWYDKHREQILRGSDSEYKDNNLDVFQYFTTTCFKGYGDDEKGFYHIYSKVFEQLAKEDSDYVDESSIPIFGNSKSDYEDVAQFYDYWMSYSTKKSYVWLDPHNIKDAPNRKIFKLIEKENDKIRQKAKRERNEEVRNLVAFVRKRDKRVQAHIKELEEKKVVNREKQKKISNQKRLDRIKQLNESSEQAEWMKFDNVNDFEEDSDTEELNNLYCVACNKIFKTPKAFKNHESSKKHRENVANLREVMLSEDLDEDLYNSDEQEHYELLTEKETIQENDISFSKTKKKNKKGKNVIKIIENDSENEISNGILDHDNFQDIPIVKKQKRKKKDKSTKKNDIKPDEDEVNSKKPISKTEADLDTDHCCVKCKAQFSSKNKLFDHLKKTGHSTHLNGNNLTERSKRRGVKQK
ncbi:dnaj subfamily c member 21 [Holotrichia oblita]|uniref:Dnaj subfamily c member 21 n=1 Tax=Holotrichia oblita TaxID=644536 RepID=A0ACB9TL68_HOLOL|nr:dnaj subfamily c member 21 [Holotrichia oblita]